MPAQLNRIESEYIFKSFLEEKPVITILHSNGLLRLNKMQYKIKDSCIFFANKTGEAAGEVKVLFTHKKRPLYFTGKINIQKEFSFFKFSSELYKYDFIEKNETGLITLTNSGGGKFSADISPDFPLKLNVENLSDSLKNDLSRQDEYEEFLLFKESFFSAAELPKDDLPPALTERVYEIAEKGKRPKHEPALVFSDGSYMLIFSTAQNTKRISSMQSARTEIRLGRRQIKFLSSFLFEYPLKGIFYKKEYSITCLAIDGIQEEDKRFLYENTYFSKYGK